jgi:signal transduction histidine kinase
VALTLGRPVPGADALPPAEAATNAASAEWDAASGQTSDLIGRVAVTAQQDLVAAASVLAGDARAAAIRDGVLVFALIALTMVLLAIVARSLLRPLRALRASALEIAQRGLPERTERMVVVDGLTPSMDVEPIGVHTQDEIGEVARAFDAVHAAAVRLAAEQALLRHHVNDIFVNLSQRSQGLVSRQLQLIDWLERSERNPAQLGELYRLDHLAARMRRNNENLLVLAGESPQRTGRVGPASLQDVLRAAVSEIEQYRQVNVGRAPDIAVVGPVAADLVHLLAELLDNATAHGLLVALDARLESDGGIAIDVVDAGPGIEAPELATLNARLAEPPPVDASVSRRMGLFVVGRLAQHHGIAVTLQPVTGGPGIRAVVTLRSRLLSIDQIAAVPGVTGRIPAVVPEPRSPWPDRAPAAGR